MEEGFIEQSMSNTASFHKKAIAPQLEWYKKRFGTRVVVNRTNKSSKYKKVFGSVYTSTFEDDKEKEEFEYRIVINRNTMIKLFQKQVDTLNFYDSGNVLQLGDILTYSAGGQQFKFKITDVMTFSESDDSIISQYTISGLIENNL